MSKEAKMKACEKNCVIVHLILIKIKNTKDVYTVKARFLNFSGVTHFTPHY